MVMWFYKPSELTDKPFDFWPSQRQSYDQRINSTTRFIIYSSLIVYAMRRDVRVLVLMGMLIAAIFLLVKLEPPNGPTASMISRDNPVGNVLLSDYEMYPNRPATYADPDLIRSQMENIFPSDTRVAERQWYTMPNTTIPSDQDGMLKYMYGGRTENCRSNAAFCEPWIPEEVTIRNRR